MHDCLHIDTSDKEINHIFDNLNKTGMYCIKDAISRELLDSLRNEIKSELVSKGDRYYSKINPANNSQSTFSAIKKNTNFIYLTNTLSSKALGRDVDDSESLNVLRVVTGKKADTQTLKFHFDAYALTVLIPIFIPDGPLEDSGHLVSFLNLRKLRKFQFVNMMQKALVQNSLTRKILGFVVRRNPKKYVSEMIPGNAYLFWGYRTLHANFSVDKNLLRSTFLYHKGDVHQKSIFDKTIKNRRQKFEKKQAENG